MRSSTRRKVGKDRDYLAWVHTLRTAIPLCSAYHQDGPHAIHRMGKEFWLFHKLDPEAVVEALNSLYERLKEHAA